MRTRGAGIAVVAVLSVALTGALAGCGTVKAGDPTSVTATGNPSGGAQTGALAQLQKAGESTTAAKSAKVHEIITENGQTRTSEGELSWDGGAQSVMKEQLPDAEKAKLQSDGTAEMIQTRTAMYVNMHSSVMATMSGGAHWLEYDNADAQKANAMGAAYVALAASADPVAEIRALIASGKVTNPRTETINGVPTTHYSGLLTPDDFTTHGSSADAALAAHRQALIAEGVKTVQIDLWVDYKNLVVRHDDLKTLATGGTISGQVDYSDYGVQFQATPPPAADTFNAGKRLANAGKASGQPVVS